jgi:RNA polymerase sigma factor (sigma-70 family)
MEKRRRGRAKKITIEAIKPLLPLIYHVILSHFRWVLPRLKRELYDIRDLHQEGILGIIRAIQLYNPKKGRLENYVSWHIRAKIGRFLAYNSLPNVTIPIHKSASRSFLPIDEPFTGRAAITPAGIISVGNYQFLAPESERQASMRKLALLALKQISRRDRRLILKYFGICNCKANRAAHHHHPTTLDEMGKEMGVSSQWVSQKLRGVLTRLRNNKHLHKIKQEWQAL